jgi:phage shock protein A
MELSASLPKRATLDGFKGRPEEMSESIVVRVKRIVTANVFDVVERMEKSQAEIVMKEAVREVETAIADIRGEQGKAKLRHVQATKQHEAHQKKVAELAEKMEFAIEQDRDDLAKAAIARQIDLEAQMKVLTEAVAEAETEDAKLADYVVALQARKRDMEEQLKIIIAAKADVAATMPGANVTAPMARADNATEVFRRAMDGATSLQAMKSTAADMAKLNELEQLSHAAIIEKRLEAAKQRKSA